MFEKLIDVLLSVVELFYVCRVVDAWEAGVVLRFGKFHRAVGPGLRWVIPLAVERVVTCDTYPRVTKLPEQSLTTSDGVGAVLRVVVTHRVANAKKVLLECGDHEESLLDALTGVVARHVMGARYSDLSTDELWGTILSEVRTKSRRLGIKVLDVQPADLVRCRSLRLFVDGKNRA